MTKEEAKEFLTHYICCCPYGTSPTNCDNAKCEFGIAVRTLCDEEKPQEEIDTKQYITEEDYKYNKKKHRYEVDND